MADLENVSQWQGQNVIDSDGDKIGKLEDVYVDTETDRPAFGVVQVGVFGRHRWAFVPLDGVTVGPGHLQVRASKKTVKDAPSLEPKGELAKDDEEGIYAHYGMPYSAPSPGGGRRLARR
jgi:hypothetical protein